MWFVKELTSSFAEHFFVTHTDKTYENDTWILLGEFVVHDMLLEFRSNTVLIENVILKPNEWVILYWLLEFSLPSYISFFI